MNSKELMESRRYLSHIGVWPGPKRLDVEGWMNNFDEGDDTNVASALLESHVHLDEEQIAYAVASTVRSISSGLEFGNSQQRVTNWQEFVDQVLVSFPLSRSGDATASGYIFARIAERIGFAEDRILDSEHLIKRLRSGGPRPVIFLDDLAASGTQFARDWVRNYTTSNGRISLRDLQSAGSITAAYYLPLVSTQAAKTKIETDCGIQVVPTYLLDEDYGALSTNSRVLPEKLRSLLPPFLAKYSPLTGKNEYGEAGFGDLGLALSFHHGCPNNTLPVLQWAAKTSEWGPLVS
jgi:hypothetical protein